MIDLCITDQGDQRHGSPRLPPSAMKQLFLWNNESRTNPASNDLGSPAPDQEFHYESAAQDLEQLATPPNTPDCGEPGVACGVEDLPIAKPLPAAVAAGAFGWTTEGPISPDDEEVAALTAEHANGMIVLLSDCHAVEDALRFGYDPATRRIPATAEKRDALVQSLQKEHEQLVGSYTDAVNVYADAFGESAAAELDRSVRSIVAAGDPHKSPYPPSHPWHYFHAGDNAPPLPVDQIPVDDDAGRFLEPGLPKNSAKRIARLREWLTREQEQLQADKNRYAEIVERGAEALSRYDREIAYSSDEMARACALALKYRHVSLALGRLRWIEAELKRMGANELFISG